MQQQGDKYKYIESFGMHSNKLLSETNDVFKEALKLSKGKTNNKFAYEASQMGVPASVIAQYYCNITEYENCRRGAKVNKDMQSEGYRKVKKSEKPFYRELLQVKARVPMFKDTYLYRNMVSKFGEDFVKYALSVKDNVTTSQAMYSKFRDKVTWDVRSSIAVQDALRDALYLNFNVESYSKLIIKLDTESANKLKDKSINVENIVQSMWMGQGTQLGDDCRKHIVYDMQSYANIPVELLHEAKLLVESDVDAKQVKHYSCAALRPFSHMVSISAHQAQYGPTEDNKYCSLYMEGMYAAMKEMGVGIYPVGTVSRFNKTVYNKVTKKIIGLNEKYQKMILSNKNTVEPAIIRQTIVGMFNAESSKTGYKMFIREDMPAPTLKKKQEKPAKKQKTSTKKASFVEIEVGGKKFYKYEIGKKGAK